MLVHQAARITLWPYQTDEALIGSVSSRMSLSQS